MSYKNSKEGRASFNPELSIFDYNKLKIDWLCAQHTHTNTHTNTRWEN